MKFSLTVVVLGLFLIGAQVVAAYVDNFLTLAQMKAKGFSKGLPLLYHAGIWGDLIITPVLAYIVANHAIEWHRSDIVLAHMVGVLLIVGFGFLWVSSAKHGLPEAHTYSGKMTPAGFAHAIYFTEAITGIILFFFYSKITQMEASIISVILGFHVLYGTHVFLGLYAPEWFTNRPQKDPITWTVIIVSWSALLWRYLTIH
jgi:hypothetical protein